MKIKHVLIYISCFSWVSLYANPLVDVYGSFDKIALKFLIMGVVVPPIAIYMLYQDENAESPTKWDIIVTFLLSIVLIWMGYEISQGTFIPVWGGLIISFILGLFSLSIVMKVKEKITGKGGIIDALSTSVKKWISKRIGNGE